MDYIYLCSLHAFLNCRIFLIAKQFLQREKQRQELRMDKEEEYGFTYGSEERNGLYLKNIN